MSKASITNHRVLVSHFLQHLSMLLAFRALSHDVSKLSEPELPFFEQPHRPYMSKEYVANLDHPAIKHHYAVNSHHPQHFKTGVNEMTLIDIIEMLCDWIAANANNPTGNLADTTKINIERFGIGDQLARILLNTIGELGFTNDIKEASNEPA